jgi:hypothetical protein
MKRLNLGVACLVVVVFLGVGCGGSGPNGLASNGILAQPQTKPAIAPARVLARRPTEAEWERGAQ